MIKLCSYFCESEIIYYYNNTCVNKKSRMSLYYLYNISNKCMSNKKKKEIINEIRDK